MTTPNPGFRAHVRHTHTVLALTMAVCALAGLSVRAFGEDRQNALQLRVTVPPPPTVPPLPAMVPPPSATATSGGVMLEPRWSMLPPDATLPAAPKATGIVPWCYPYCWGPGDPLIYTRYFDTESDFDSETNPHNVPAGGTVPRNAHAVELVVDINTLSGGDCGYPGCPMTWFFEQYDRSDAVVAFYRLYAFSSAGLRYTQLVYEGPDGSGEWWLTSGSIRILMPLMLLHCSYPDGGYAQGARFFYGSGAAGYFERFSYSIGGGSSARCGPAAPTAVSPQGCVNTLTPTLSWTPSLGASYYKVTVQDDQTGSAVVSDAQVTSTSYVVPTGRLTAARQYKWSVTAGNSNGESGDSNILRFTAICGVPAVPVPISPSGCTNTRTPTLSWSSSDGATSYTYEVPGVGTGTVSSTSVTLPTLEADHEYDWRVLARNALGASAYSPYMHFKVLCTPPAPTNLSPQGHIDGSTPTLSWSPSQGATSYSVTIYSIEPEPDVRVWNRVVSDTSVTVESHVLERRQYAWWIWAGNSDGWSEPAWAYLYPLSGPPREAPVLYGPSDCLDDWAPRFWWGEVLRAEAYDLEILDANAAVVATARTEVTTRDDSPVGIVEYRPAAGALEPGKQYYWRVTAVNNDGRGPTSESMPLRIFCDLPDDEDPSIRPGETGGPCGGPDSVGLPVSVSTGNMYLDQTDVAVSGVNSLVFSRSYNSANVTDGRYGMFGRGWNHSYELSLSFPLPGMLKLREANGSPLFFMDPEGDQTYVPMTPASEQSTVVRLGDGSYERRFRRGGSESFNSAGALTQITDAVGNATRLERSPGGQIVSIIDAGGRALAFTYEGSSLVSVAGPENLATAAFTYENGQLKTVRYADGTGYAFGYDGSGRLLRVYDARGSVLETHTYDPASGRAMSSSISQGQESYTLTYETGQTEVTDALGNTAAYEYADVNYTKRVVRITGSCAMCGGGGSDLQEWTYDDAGRVTSHKDAEGRTTFYEYDPETGDLSLVKDALLNTTIYTYDPQGRVLTVTGADGSRTTTTYVEAGPATVTEAIDAEASRTTSFTYTPQGKVAEVTDARGKTRAFRYNSFGDLVSVSDPTDPQGEATRFEHDALGRVTVVEDALHHKTTTAYPTPTKRRIRVTRNDGAFTSISYDLGGRPVAAKDALGRNTRSVYDPFGRLQATIDPLGGVTYRGYDLMSHVTSVTDARGNATSFEYDAHGRVSRVVYPGSGVESWSYDTLGRLVARTDRNGTVTSYAYDALGRLLRKSYSDGTPEVSYTYDAVGRMTVAASEADTLSWTYDLSGRMLTETSDRRASTVAYTYDVAGNRSSVSLGAFRLTYAYDDASRLETIRAPGHEFNLEYDEVFRRESLRYPNGVVTTYRYDDVNRLTSIEALAGSAAISRWTYVYDAADNRTSKAGTDYAEGYAYDGLDRLTEAQRSSGPAPGTSLPSGYQYDAVGNRVAEQIAGVILESTHDERNQLRETQPGGPVPVEVVLDEPGSVSVNGRPAAALAGNRFESSVNTTPGENVIAVSAQDSSGNVANQSYQLAVPSSQTTHTYDANGNLVQKVEGSRTTAYYWNAENQLLRVTATDAGSPPVELARFTYDPLGRRMEKIAGAVQTGYLYDGQNILREVRTGGTVYFYVHGPGIDEPLARANVSTLTVEYYHADGLGSIVATTDSYGNVISRHQYDAWGNLEVGADQPGYAFTGREWDPETQLYYYRARYYDPKIGRFLSEDPIGLHGGINFYSYTGNNPVSRVDPMGLQYAPARDSNGNISAEPFVKYPSLQEFDYFKVTISSPVGPWGASAAWSLIFANGTTSTSVAAGVGAGVWLSGGGGKVCVANSTMQVQQDAINGLALTWSLALGIGPGGSYTVPGGPYSKEFNVGLGFFIGASLTVPLPNGAPMGGHHPHPQ